ncbi:MAG TPA: glycosyltransferase [Pseudobdellovibrionaceae bacterium]|jgi:hypothetical protein
MPPQPQLSLCVPLCSEKELIQEFHENLSHFFQRIPLVYEVLFAVNPGQSESLFLLQKLIEKNPQYRILENKKNFKNKFSRAQNIQMLCANARGSILIPIDLDLVVPLSEIFKILEAFFSDTELEVVFGNRFKAKKNIENQNLEQDRLEKFFMEILKEKTPWKFADPFCPMLGLRRTSFEKIEKELKSSGWHWNHEVQRLVQSKGLKSQEIPLYVGVRGRLKIPKSEIFHLLNFVLFRI